nr:hypothetical protein [Mycobacterium sp. 1245852.3]
MPRRSCDVDRGAAERIQVGAVYAHNSRSEAAGGKLSVVDPLLDDAGRDPEFVCDF